MASQRTALLVALTLLLIPLTISIPLTALTSDTSTAYTTSIQTTVTTTAVLQTYFGSTEGIALVQVPIEVPPRVIGFVAPKGKCSQFTLPLTVTSGSILNLKITSNNPANLYLLPTYTYQTSPNGCSLVGGAMVTASNFTAYTLHWTAPENGTFYLLFTGPTTIIILNDLGSTQPAEQNATLTYATSTETNFNEYSSTATTTYTTTTTDPTPLYLQPPTLYSLEIVALLIAFLGIVLLAVLRLRRG